MHIYERPYRITDLLFRINFHNRRGKDKSLAFPYAHRIESSSSSVAGSRWLDRNASLDVPPDIFSNPRTVEVGSRKPALKAVHHTPDLRPQRYVGIGVTPAIRLMILLPPSA